MAERPFPLQRIHNFPLRGRGTPGLRQGHNAPCPPGAHRSESSPLPLRPPPPVPPPLPTSVATANCSACCGLRTSERSGRRPPLAPGYVSRAGGGKGTRTRSRLAAWRPRTRAHPMTPASSRRAVATHPAVTTATRNKGTGAVATGGARSSVRACVGTASGC